MKKFVLLFIAFLCSCKSVAYNDIIPEVKPNGNLLPALRADIDIRSLEAAYPAGSLSDEAENYGGGLGINGWGEDKKKSKRKSSRNKDIRVNDTVNIFEKEVKENITVPYGSPKGYISLKLGYRGNERTYMYKAPSAITLHLVNLFGFPNDRVEQTLEIEVAILNNQREVVRRYTEIVSNDNFVAMYWGYTAPDALRKTSADNMKQALKNIRRQINADAVDIQKQLK